MLWMSDVDHVAFPTWNENEHCVLHSREIEISILLLGPHHWVNLIRILYMCTCILRYIRPTGFTSSEGRPLALRFFGRTLGFLIFFHIFLCFFTTLSLLVNRLATKGKPSHEQRRMTSVIRTIQHIHWLCRTVVTWYWMELADTAGFHHHLITPAKHFTTQRWECRTNPLDLVFKTTAMQNGHTNHPVSHVFPALWSTLLSFIMSVFNVCFLSCSSNNLMDSIHSIHVFHVRTKR